MSAHPRRRTLSGGAEPDPSGDAIVGLSELFENARTWSDRLAPRRWRSVAQSVARDGDRPRGAERLAGSPDRELRCPGCAIERGARRATACAMQWPMPLAPGRFRRSTRSWSSPPGATGSASRARSARPSWAACSSGAGRSSTHTCTSSPRRRDGAASQASRPSARRSPGDRRHAGRRRGVLRLGIRPARRVPCGCRARRRVGGAGPRHRRASVAVGRRVRRDAMRLRGERLGLDGARHRAPGGREPVRRRAARRERVGVGRRRARPTAGGSSAAAPTSTRAGACAPRASQPADPARATPTTGFRIAIDAHPEERSTA